MASTLNRVAEVLAEYAGTSDPIAPETHLVEDLRLDSLDAVEISLTLEDEFGVEITDEELEDWQTVSDIVKSVTKAVRHG